jgi:hypothetical protein
LKFNGFRERIDNASSCAHGTIEKHGASEASLAWNTASVSDV